MTEYEDMKEQGIILVGKPVQAEWIARQNKEKPEKPVPLRDQITLADILETVDRTIERYRREWEAEWNELQSAIHDAMTDKTPIPPNYWQAEHRARGLYASAVHFKEMMKP